MRIRLVVPTETYIKQNTIIACRIGFVISMFHNTVVSECLSATWCFLVVQPDRYIPSHFLVIIPMYEYTTEVQVRQPLKLPPRYFAHNGAAGQERGDIPLWCCNITLNDYTFKWCITLQGAAIFRTFFLPAQWDYIFKRNIPDILIHLWYDTAT